MSNQEKLIQFQTLQANLQKFEQRERLLIQGIDDLERTRFALEELKGASGKAYIPVGANNFVKGTIEDSENVLISIGAGIAVKKTRQEALKISEDRIVEFKHEAEKTIKDMKKMSSELQKLQAELQQK